MIETIEPVIHTSLSHDEMLHNPVYFAVLSNGERAYSRHDRRSWLELKAWLAQHKDVYIQGLHFNFRDHYITIGSDKEGYFFSHGVQCFLGQSEQRFFIGGYVENGFIYRKRYIVPELITNDVDDDQFSIYDPKIKDGLILNNE